MMTTQLEEIENLIGKSEESLNETDLQFQILRKKCEKLFRQPKYKKRKMRMGITEQGEEEISEEDQ